MVGSMNKGLWQTMWAGMLALALLVGSAPALAGEGEATRQIRTSVEKAVAILLDPQFTAPEKLENRRALMLEVIYARFDFGLMAQRAVGNKWRKFSDPQKERFTALFRQVLENAYIAKVESYKGEPFVFTKEISQAEAMARVESTVRYKGQEYNLAYQMVLQGNQWRVYDVIVEGVSLVANYRSQFQQILNQDDVDSLIKQLDEKVNKKG